MELLALALLAFIAVQADEEVLVQEVKPTGDETVGGHDKKVKTKNTMNYVVVCACICALLFGD